MKTILLYVTLKNQSEAEAMARSLIENKLAACVNILPAVTSFYEWEGTLQTSHEVLLLAKTTHEAKPAAMAHIRQQHSYDCPCIVAFAPEDVDATFAKWIFSQIRD